MAGDSTAPESGTWLERPLTVLRGVGPRRAESLAEAFGVRTLGELLRLAPRRYEPPLPLCRIAELQDGAVQRMRARVTGCSVWRGRGRRILQVRFEDESGRATAVYFNQAYLKDAFPAGRELIFEGQVALTKGVRVYAPRIVAEAALEERGLRAVYSQVEGVSAGLLPRALHAALDVLPELADPLPRLVRAAAGVPELSAALRELHRPPDLARAEAARRRLAWGEVLRLEFGRRQARLRAATAAPAGVSPSAAVWQRILDRLPFALTADQAEVLAVLRADLGAGPPMQRLLHGEVGSGKTAVAFALALAMAAQGRQSVLLAPTEILARQHLATFGGWLDGARVAVRGLLGDDSPAQRRAALAEIAGGTAAIAIGTHALYGPAVRFHDLGLVIFDEQHRFGVRQKGALLAKAQAPHVLTMTATPIPRTLAWARYGALEPCVLRARPGIGAVRTELGVPAQLAEVAVAWRPRLEAGERAFVVAPRIDGEEGLLAKAAALTGGPWRGLPTETVHGRLPGAEIEAAVTRFRSGAARVLFGTTVVEVGLDVAAVECMLVLDAHRLGLASLHQLRGRLARGVDAGVGHCLLLADPAAHGRLQVLVECADGFAIAAADLRTRGPGALRGTRQHGRTDFRAFDPERDAAMMTALRAPQVRLWLDAGAGSAAVAASESGCPATSPA
ncbi:MAG TPA: DEAD/DEAH box helicase [Planctomycetota bacterium]